MYEYRDEHFGRLLQTAYRDFNARALGKMHQAGYKDLTQFEAELVSYIELDGSRIRSLTLKTGVTKQAIGEAVSRLVSLGYIKKVRDPADKRAQILRFTTLGEQFLLDAHRVKADIEQQYMAILGRPVFESLQKNLHRLASHKH